jgi:ABC-type Na+ efflux pump permease subunit
MAIFMTTMFGGGIALIKDRELGIIEGYLVTPVKRASIILGMIGSGTVRAFLAGVTIFFVDLLITGILIRSSGSASKGCCSTNMRPRIRGGRAETYCFRSEDCFSWRTGDPPFTFLCMKAR